MNRTCIYCLEQKEASDFNVEHVLPQAFGKFENNVTLDCVCARCNQSLGDSVDRKLARDTVEGLDRFLTGMKAPAEFKHYGREATTRVEVAQDGPMKGAWMKYTPSMTTSGDFDVEPLPQVGFSKAEDGPYEYFPLERIPERAVLEEKGFARGEPVYLRAWGTTKEDAIALLGGRGYTWSTETELPDSIPTQGRTKVETVFRISHPEFRAVAKIGLGYLASVCGSDVARLPALHAVRRYIIQDERPSERIVDIPRASETSGNGHMVSLAQRADGSVITCVTLFCRFLYVVRLTDAPLGHDVPDATHFFDLAARRAHRIL